MHAHLDHEHGLETVILRGELAAVRQFAGALSTLVVARGSGNLKLVVRKPEV